MSIHLLGLALSAGQAVALAAGLAGTAGVGLGWLLRDFRAWNATPAAQPPTTRYYRHTDSVLAWRQDPALPVPKEARSTHH